MSEEKPSLYEFTDWLSDNYNTNASPARAGSLGEYFFKCDETKQYIFTWNGNSWNKEAIVTFSSEYEARRRHRELCNSTNDEVGWDPESFIEKYSE